MQHSPRDQRDSSSFSALQRAENSSICARNSCTRARRCFSALQRAENSSIGRVDGRLQAGAAFQCSSASRKFLNAIFRDVLYQHRKFQCSSASRKFLNLLDAKRQAGSHYVSVLFSEPKIPQPRMSKRTRLAFCCFSALQRAENSSTFRQRIARDRLKGFSALQRAENSSTVNALVVEMVNNGVSVLFSEPKIPQCQYVPGCTGRNTTFQCSSASRKFLNGYRDYDDRVIIQFQCSSASRKFLNPLLRVEQRKHILMFQCSSASRKFLNLRIPACAHRQLIGFSALQRAENSSIDYFVITMPLNAGFSALQRAENSSIRQLIVVITCKFSFQCSSASRKFLNWTTRALCRKNSQSFSALQRAENSSIAHCADRHCHRWSVSVLFSEPKIPQSCAATVLHTR